MERNLQSIEVFFNAPKRVIRLRFDDNTETEIREHTLAECFRDEVKIDKKDIDKLVGYTIEKDRMTVELSPALPDREKAKRISNLQTTEYLQQVRTRAIDRITLEVSNKLARDRFEQLLSAIYSVATAIRESVDKR